MVTPIMRWRWEQGRIECFQFENLRGIATALRPLEGVELGTPDKLREPLQKETGLGFLPTHYSVWRNYARAFQGALIATAVDDKLRLTDVGKALDKAQPKQMPSDDFFALMAQRFCIPFPGFADYDPDTKAVYPFCAVLKYLVARARSGLSQTITLDEVFSYIVGNEVTGLEKVESFSHLPPSQYAPTNDERRQVREMLVVFSQLSVLKWTGDVLHLDVDPDEDTALAALEAIATPYGGAREMDRSIEVLRLGALPSAGFVPALGPTRETIADIFFTEGKRVRVNHLRVERNRKLRQKFFDKAKPPFGCGMCGMVSSHRYPWTDNILQVHHILPMASSLRVAMEGTPLEDLVALCPTCHDAVHVYYRKWLNNKALDDFASKDQAKAVFAEAKNSYVAN